MTIVELTRNIDIEVAFNVRHIGGYTAAAGRVTSHEFIRSAGLHGLTRPGIGALRDRGLRVIIDLRSSEELEQSPTPDVSFAGIITVHAPVFERDASPVGLEEDFPGYATVYERLLERGGAAYRLLLETIASEDGAVLFHCAAGKDRTGVAAALLLTVAGVSDADIVADYSRSAELLAPQLPQWEQAMKERGADEARVRALMASNAEDMAATLEFVRARWGSAEGYLEANGVSESVLSEVRARILA